MILRNTKAEQKTMLIYGISVQQNTFIVITVKSYHIKI